jgi:DNA polymerase I-like protein with 3'-5' exonuclease and polymerase domains
MGHQLLARDGKLFVSDASRLSDEDRAAVKAIKSELLAYATPWAEPSLVTFLGHVSPQEQNAWIAKEPPSLDGINTLEFDTETTGLRWWENDRPIGLSCRRPDGSTFYLPWGHAGGNLDEAVVKRWCERELRGKHLVGAGIKFDVNMMKSWGIDLEEQGCTLGDVQIYAALLDDSRKKFNLDILSKDFLGKEKTGHELDKTRMATYHASEVAAYAESDAALTGELRAVMMPLLNAEDLQRVRQLEDDVIYPVCHMERNGAPLDLELLDRWVKESETKYNNCMWMLAKETGQSINPDAARDLEKLFEHLHLPIVRLPSGAPSFTDAILKRIDHPVIKQVRFATKLSDLRSRYLLKYQKAVSSDGILRYAMHQTRYQKDTGEEGGVGPGRFSSSELTDGVGCNIQQVMKLSKQRKAFGYGEDDTTHDDEIHLIRKLIVPQEGQWLSADLMGVEYRLFAHYAGNPKVIQSFRDDPKASFHRMTVEMMRPFKPDVIYDEQKNFNFAYLYGAKTIKQAVMLGFITDEEGKAIRDAKDWNSPKLARMTEISKAFNRAMPEAETLMKKCSDLAETRGWIKDYLGRRSRFTAGGAYHKALNNLLQGGAAEYNKIKLVEIHKERKNTGLLLRFSVHDELDGDARAPDTLAKVQMILDRQSWPDLKVPLLWEIGIGPDWASAKA